jgi:hypothetical protein
LILGAKPPDPLQRSVDQRVQRSEGSEVRDKWGHYHPKPDEVAEEVDDREVPVAGRAADVVYIISTTTEEHSFLVPWIGRFIFGREAIGANLAIIASGPVPDITG